MKHCVATRGFGAGTRPMLVLGALAAALLVSASFAARSEATAIGLEFAEKTTETDTAMTLHIRYTQPNDPDAKPPPIRKIQIDAPAGTTFHGADVPACEASDAEVMALGPNACPSDSQIGDGTIVVVTGFGPPFDPFASPTPVFNDGNGWLEISQTPSVPATIAVTRLSVNGNRITGDIAATPGGPPDNQSAVSTLDLAFPVSTGYITTPPTCPSSGEWVTTGTFTFADSTTQVVQGDTPCKVTAGEGGGDDHCTRRMSGTPGDDYMRGDRSSQKIDGRAGNDHIRAGGGDDCVSGARGDDRLSGGKGSDRLRGGRGGDVTHSRGGGHDRIRCGAGRDTVYASARDRVGKSCEIVRGG